MSCTGRGNRRWPGRGRCWPLRRWAGRRLHRRGRRLCQGAAAVRADHRDLPGGQAPLRGHARGGGGGGRRGMGRLACGSRGEEQFRLAAAVAAHWLSRLCAQCRTQHSGTRRHRVHLGARRASASAPGAGDRGAVRRRRTGAGTSSSAARPGPPGRTASTCRPKPKNCAPRSAPTPPKSPPWTNRPSATN